MTAMVSHGTRRTEGSMATGSTAYFTFFLIIIDCRRLYVYGSTEASMSKAARPRHGGRLERDGCCIATLRTPSGDGSTRPTGVCVHGRVGLSGDVHSEGVGHSARGSEQRVSREEEGAPMFLAKSRAAFAKASRGALDGYSEHDHGRSGRGWRIVKGLLGIAFVMWTVSATYMLVRLRAKYHTEIAELFPKLTENEMIHDLIMSDPEVIVVGKDSVTAMKVSNVDFVVGSLQAQDAGDRTALAELERCPKGTEGSKIKLLIVVTSTCCSIGSRRKRQAIRDTWGRDAVRKYGDVVSIKFLLSTPRVDSEAEAAGVRKLIRNEISEVGYNDLVLLNNALETYVNLPLKTIEIMRYLKLSTWITG